MIKTSINPSNDSSEDIKASKLIKTNFGNTSTSTREVIFQQEVKKRKNAFDDKSSNNFSYNENLK